MKKRKRYSVRRLVSAALLTVAVAGAVSGADGVLRASGVRNGVLAEGRISLLQQTLPASEAEQLSSAELQLLRRFIWARAQLRFSSKDDRDRFAQYAWYKGTNSSREAAAPLLTAGDRALLETISTVLGQRTRIVVVLELLLLVILAAGGWYLWRQRGWSLRETAVRGFAAAAAVNFLGIVFSGMRIPLGSWIEHGLDRLTGAVSGLTRLFSDGLGEVIRALEQGLLAMPAYLLVALFSAAAWFLSSRRDGWRSRHALRILALTLFGLLFIHNLGLWQPTVSTITLVLIATFFSVLIGLPIGILTALNRRVYRVVFPVLDFMQTMPAFVYLIPAIPFFGLGKVSALFATVIFSMPPAIRLTCLGIRQIPEDLIEAADAFGATRSQKLFKVQIPLAVPTIMAGVNQTIMLSLSMVVIAAMIGARGLGGEVWKAIQRLKPGMGFEAGIGVVIVAMILDRVTQRIAGSAKK